VNERSTPLWNMKSEPPPRLDNPDDAIHLRQELALIVLCYARNEATCKELMDIVDATHAAIYDAGKPKLAGGNDGR